MKNIVNSDINKGEIKMNIEKMEEELIESLSAYFDEAEHGSISSIRTFIDAGLLTYQKGIVVRLEDGSAFNISISQAH